MNSSLIGFAMMTALPYFFQLQADDLRRLDERKFKEKQKIPAKEKIEKYDFIIVGGGTAGCLVARRLSQHHNVLLLEAGGHAPSLTTVPGFRETSTDAKGINYFYRSVEQRYVNNSIITTTAGKMLGGSYAHNGLIYNRGNSRDYDVWVNLTRDDSWNYKNMLKIYKNLETYSGPFPSDQRGTKGPIPIHTGNPPALQFYKEAANELGYAYGDNNGPQNEGFGPLDFTQKNGRAVTTCSIFVEPILGIRQKLTVKLYSTVTKILFNLKAAMGVTYTRHGVKFVVHAEKEVIISSGTFASPLLLIKSGIGPKNILVNAKIPMVANLPVGQILLNHATLRFNVTFRATLSKYIVTPQYNLTDEKFQRYLESGTDGVLSETGFGPGAFFVSSIAKSAGEGNWPDIQYTRGAAEVDANGSVFVQARITLTRPKSVGSLSLNTTRYRKGERLDTKLSLIDWNLLQHKEDKDRLLEGIQKILSMYTKTKAFRSHRMEVIPYKICSDKYTMHSDSYWVCVVEHAASTVHHAASTCKMGYGAEDQTAVVDTKFRVIGLEKLRIIDGSVFPHTTNANINAPVMLLAEIASKKIIEFYADTANYSIRNTI